jgi:hypothetical protein
MEIAITIIEEQAVLIRWFAKQIHIAIGQVVTIWLGV